jgi:hypothetical protein
MEALAAEGVEHEPPASALPPPAERSLSTSCHTCPEAQGGAFHVSHRVRLRPASRREGAAAPHAPPRRACAAGAPWWAPAHLEARVHSFAGRRLARENGGPAAVGAGAARGPRLDGGEPPATRGAARRALWPAARVRRKGRRGAGLLRLRLLLLLRVHAHGEARPAPSGGPGGARPSRRDGAGHDATGAAAGAQAGARALAAAAAGVRGGMHARLRRARGRPGARVDRSP